MNKGLNSVTESYIQPANMQQLQALFVGVGFIRCGASHQPRGVMPLLSSLTRGLSNAGKPTKVKHFIKTATKGQQSPSKVFPQNQKRFIKATSSAQGVSPLSDPENKGQRQVGVNFDVLGSWNYRLDLQVNVQQSIKRGSLVPEISLDKVSSTSLLGRRKENEDRVLLCRVRPGVLMFAVFDGHAGHQAAEYAQQHMLDHVKFWMDRGERNLEIVLHKAFVDLNNIFTRHQHKISKDEDHSMSSGTTATVCLLVDDIHLYVGHVGDSRAILCRESKAVKLTREHCPDDEEEALRIKEKGGHITWSSIGKPRINGKLQMTRSIGDLELKPYGVTAKPDTQKILVRHSHDAFLVLCTDGVHNVLNSQELVDIICSSRDPSEAAKMASDQALLFGSEDNSTTVVIPFGAWGKFMPDKFMSTFTRSFVGSRFH